MTYSEHDLAGELREVLKGFSGAIDYGQVADWAYQTYLRHARDIGPDVKQLLVSLEAMAMGPEFALPDGRLREIAQWNY
ncbi:hypothetical protein [Dyella solisilvae]|nr:hypothetical protein [Dyella solisilvae]